MDRLSSSSTTGQTDLEMLSLVASQTQATAPADSADEVESHPGVMYTSELCWPVKCPQCSHIYDTVKVILADTDAYSPRKCHYNDLTRLVNKVNKAHSTSKSNAELLSQFSQFITELNQIHTRLAEQVASTNNKKVVALPPRNLEMDNLQTTTAPSHRRRRKNSARSTLAQAPPGQISQLSPARSTTPLRKRTPPPSPLRRSTTPRSVNPSTVLPSSSSMQHGHNPPPLPHPHPLPLTTSPPFALPPQSSTSTPSSSLPPQNIFFPMPIENQETATYQQTSETPNPNPLPQHPPLREQSLESTASLPIGSDPHFIAFCRAFNILPKEQQSTLMDQLVQAHSQSEGHHPPFQ